MRSSTGERFPLLFYFFALLLGVGCGLLEIMDRNDPLLLALAVTASSMLLGVLRPARPWRWVLLVGGPVPLALVIASIVTPAAHFTRASIAGSLLIVLPGIAGAFGGSVLRRKMQELFFEDSSGSGQA